MEEISLHNLMPYLFYITITYNIDMKYRSRTEIIKLILEIASKGATKTKIMYSAYLSYTQLCEYMSFLVENNLIELQHKSKIYTLTEKGKRVYLKFKELDELVGSGGLQTNSIGAKELLTRQVSKA
jgi:predicted transcriptional regulator